MLSLNHIHQYRRHLTKKHIFFCIDPSCKGKNGGRHYIQDPELLIGCESICNKCGEKFILNRKQLNNLNPVCLNCSKSKKKIIVNTAKGLLEKVFEEEMRKI